MGSTMVMTTTLEDAVHRASLVMSEQQVKAFREKAQVDATLWGKLQSASDADAVISLAVAAGFATAMEKRNQPQSALLELSDDLLQGVAGGVSRERSWTSP